MPNLFACMPRYCNYQGEGELVSAKWLPPTTNVAMGCGAHNLRSEAHGTSNLAPKPVSSFCSFFLFVPQILQQSRGLLL